MYFLAGINEERTSDKSRRFIFGVYTLTLSTVLVKIIGIIYKIPMLRLLGSVGMGYFNSAYEIYAAFCVIATSGLPVAMSLLMSSTVSKRRQGEIFGVSFATVLTLGTVCAVCILGLAYPFARFLGSEQTYYSLICVSPAIFFVCISSAYRGYFQGLGQMKQTAVSQVIEAAGKLIFGLIFAKLALISGLDQSRAAGLAALGLAFAEGACLLYLLISKGRDRRMYATNELLAERGSGQERRDIFKSLMRTVLPIMLSSSALSIVRLIDMTLIFRRLGGLNIGSEQINAIYGSYTTLAVPLFSLAPALVGAVALPIVPTVASARAEGDTDTQSSVVSRAFKLTSLIAAPVGAGLVMFSLPILTMIFGNDGNAVGYASPLLTLLGMSVLMSCIITVQNSVLQSYSHPSLPLVSMLAGSAVKIVVCFILLGNRSVNIFAVPIGTFVCDLIIGTLNFLFISRHTPLKLGIWDIIARPYMCGICACVGAYAIMRFSCHGEIPIRTPFTLMCVCLSALLYVIMLLLTRAIDMDEIRLFLPTRHKSKNEERKNGKGSDNTEKKGAFE